MHKKGNKMYYAFIEDNKLIGCGQCICENVTCIEITENIFNNIDRYAYINGEIVEDPDYDERQIKKAKKAKYAENEKIRDEFLVSGVTYKDVVFDSDTDQKINILATVSTMSDADTINWYGKDGVSYVVCTKADLLAIGELITRTTAYVWQYRNPEIKDLIEKAQTIEELDAIDISYEPVTIESEV